jgi:hypothetical protein
MVEISLGDSTPLTSAVPMRRRAVFDSIASYIDIAIIIYIINIEFGTLHATRMLFESHAGSGANVGEITPGMAKSSSLRAHKTSRIKKIPKDAKDMKETR